VKLLRGSGPILRIGHRGAAALAPPNTVAAVEAALALDADLVELDVLAGPRSSLLIGHSHGELEAEPANPDDVFSVLAGSPRTGLLVDVKGAGFEDRLVASLRRHGLVERAVACTYRLSTLQELRRLEPRLARSRTYPPSRLYLWGRRTSLPLGGPAWLPMRLALPYLAARLLGDAGAIAMTLRHSLVTRAVVERCHSLGAAIFVWTVNDPALLQELDALGVDGVITDDPRIFTSSRATLQA
jgi:glycerophosphoryl diester phosphodiesterase